MRGDYPLIVFALSMAAVSAIAQPSPQDNVPAPPPPRQAEPVPPPKNPSTDIPSPPPSVTILDSVDAQGILGRDVRSAADENMGRIVDVVVDRAGQVRAAVIDFGGFLGVGSRKIAVDWGALHFGHAIDKGDRITLELTREQVKAAPEYKEGKPVVVLGASGGLEPLRFPPTPTEK